MSELNDAFGSWVGVLEGEHATGVRWRSGQSRVWAVDRSVSRQFVEQKQCDVVAFPSVIVESVGSACSLSSHLVFLLAI